MKSKLAEINDDSDTLKTLYKHNFGIVNNWKTLKELYVEKAEKILDNARNLTEQDFEKEYGVEIANKSS